MLRRECQRIISGKTVAKVAIVGGGRKQNGRLGAEDVAKLLYGAKIANIWRNFQIANRAQGSERAVFGAIGGRAGGGKGRIRRATMGGGE